MSSVRSNHLEVENDLISIAVIRDEQGHTIAIFQTQEVSCVEAYGQAQGLVVITLSSGNSFSVRGEVREVSLKLGLCFGTFTPNNEFNPNRSQAV